MAIWFQDIGAWPFYECCILCGLFIVSFYSHQLIWLCGTWSSFCIHLCKKLWLSNSGHDMRWPTLERLLFLAIGNPDALCACKLGATGSFSSSCSITEPTRLLRGRGSSMDPILFKFCAFSTGEASSAYWTSDLTINPGRFHIWRLPLSVASKRIVKVSLLFATL